MPGSGVWLDDETYLKTAGQMWAQQQTQTLQAGHDWANQQIQQTLSQLQQMVPQVSTQPAPAPVTPPPVMPPPEAPPPVPVQPPAPQVPIGGTPVAPPIPTPAPPMPTPIPQPAQASPQPLPTSAVPAAGPDAGETWAQQQIQNLLNPSTAPQPSSTTPPTDALAPTQPSVPVPSSTPAGTGGGDLPSATVGQGQQDFLSSLQPLAQQVAAKTGIDANAMLGIAANETGWGRSSNAQQQNNLFSVQGDGSNGSRWASYNSPADSFQAFADLIQNSPRYAQAWASRADPSKFVDELRNAGYVADEPGFPAQGWVDQVKGIVNNLPQQAQSVVQQGVQAVNTTVQAAQAAFARAQPVEPQRQFEQEAGLSAGDAYTACGPVAAAAFAKTYGRNPTPTEAIDLARQVGWNPNTGMAGVGSEVQLLKAMGIDAHATAGVDWANVGRDASGGNPVIIDTPGHYYYVDGYNQDTGQLHVGASGLALRGGSEWMTPDQINGMAQSHGPARAAIFADHPLAQQDGLAQSVKGQNLTMGAMQPGSDTSQPDLVSLAGQGLANVPLPFLGGQSSADIGNLLGRNVQQAQTGRDLVSSLLSPTDQGQIGKQANSIVQAVQDVGSKATQAGQDLLQQGQQALQQVPQTVGDILQQNALTSQGIPNIGGKALEGLGQSQFMRNLTGTNPNQAELNQGFSNAQQVAQQATGAGVTVPSNPLDMLGGMSPLGVGAAGEQLTAQRNAAIEQANPLRDVPLVGGASTLAAQAALDPTTWLLGAGPELGRAALPAVGELAGNQALREFLAGESGELRLPGGAMPGQLPLLPEQTYQPLMPEGAGGAGVPSAPSTQEWLRGLDTAQTQQHFDQLQQTLDRAGLLGDRPSTQTVGGQAVMPGMQPGAPVTMAERARLYHVGNVISSTATLAKVAINSMFNPAWSFASRGAADLAGATPLGRLAGIAPEEALGRAQGSVIGAQGSMATWGDQFMNGFRAPYSRASSLAARETNPVAQAWAKAWETPGALHNAFQTAGQSVLEQMEIGRLAGQDAASQGLKGADFRDEVARLMADPRPGWTDSARGIAQRAVLRGDLGSLGQMFGNLAGQGAVGGTGGTARQVIGNVLFPVFRIGMNALTQGVEKSPLGLAGTGIDVARAVLGKGPYAAAGAGLGPSFERPLSSAVAPLSERLTNNLVGTAVTAALAKYAADGSITGAGPSDPQQRAVLLAQGWQPNSIRTPFGYVSYQGTPIEVAAGLVGEFADAIHNPMSKREMQQPHTDVVAERLFAGTVNMLTSRTGLETLGQLSDMIHTAAQDPEQAKTQFGTGLAANILSGYVPMAGPLRDIAKATDPLMRQPAPGDLGAALGQNIPLLRQQVQPRLDVLGRAVENPQQGLGAILPARIGAGAESPIAGAMAQVGVAPPNVPLTVPYGPTHEVRLTPQERQAYQQYRGQIIQQGADALVRSAQWHQMPDYAQRAALERVDSNASAAATRMVLGDIVKAPDAGQSRMVATGVLAPVQSYAPMTASSQLDEMRSQAQHQALMQSLLGG